MNRNLKQHNKQDARQDAGQDAKQLSKQNPPGLDGWHRPNPISIVIVDDNPTFVRITSEFLEREDDFHVIGTAGDGEGALDQAKRLHPRIILIDLAMPRVSGLEAIPQLRDALPETGIIVLTMMQEEDFHRTALRLGADVFLPKSRMRTDLLPLIRHIADADSDNIEAAL
jgi:DNA-binding NarL/FixJ family response regulator